jgi:hypothetical protein
MARGRRFFDLVAEQDTRPTGSLQFADPSTAELPRHIQTFNDPHSPRSTGECSGINTRTGRLVPYGDRRSGDVWAEMNAKRGVSEKEDE